MRPEQFILTTDYATLKNDDTGVLSVTVPGGVVVPGSGIYVNSTSIQLGVAGASERAQIHSSKTNVRYVGGIIGILRIGSFPNAPNQRTYDIFVDLSRTASNTLTLTATIYNPYGDTLTGAAGNETFTAYVATFIPPFS